MPHVGFTEDSNICMYVTQDSFNFFFLFSPFRILSFLAYTLKKLTSSDISSFSLFLLSLFKDPFSEYFFERLLYDKAPSFLELRD